MITSSGKKAISALIYTGICRLRGVSLTADIAKSPTITVEDNITAVGTYIKAFGRASGGTVANGGAHNFNIKFSKEENVICNNGLYASISDTDNGDYIVYYEIL